MASTVGPPKLENFVLSEKIGSGSYADVYKAHVKNKPREVVAIKCVLKSSLSSSAVDNLVSEIRILKTLKHEHIVEMKDFLWDDNYIFIVMEYCSGGDLSHFVKSRQRLPEDVCQRFLQQIASALIYMREKNVSHLDLKPQNVLLSSRRKTTLKIGDFGLARPMQDTDTSDQIKGSPLYMAPEILINRQYNPKVDLWSVGVILYECLFGRAPYSSKTFKDLVDKIIVDKPIKLPVGASISPECKDLVLRCLERDVAKRINFEDFFSHAFIDLEHKPSADSMTKATDLLNVAVSLDTTDDLEEAVKCYVEALRYLVPLMHIESDAAKRAAMRRKIQDYLSRTEVLKCKLEPSKQESLSKLKIPKVSRMDSIKQKDHTNSSTTLSDLMKLSSTTPQILTGIDIAQSAELYEREGNYVLALEKYELALGKLIPLLQQEPAGRRKELLSTELNRWMSYAENVKKFTRGITEEVLQNEDESRPISAPMANAEKSCSIQ